MLEAVLNERVVDHRSVSGRSAAAEITAESRLGYGVIAVGVATRHEGQLYSPMVDEILLNATIPVVIVRRARDLERPLPAAFSRVVVPVTGTRSSSAAQEVAFSIADQLGTEVVLTHVLNRKTFVPRVLKRRTSDLDPSEVVAKELMDIATLRAVEAGVWPRTLIPSSANVPMALVGVAKDEDCDLVVLGAQLRSVDGRPFLGHTVETVLEQCDANVAVVALPRRS